MENLLITARRGQRESGTEGTLPEGKLYLLFGMSDPTPGSKRGSTPTAFLAVLSVVIFLSFRRLDLETTCTQVGEVVELSEGAIARAAGAEDAAADVDCMLPPGSALAM